MIFKYLLCFCISIVILSSCSSFNYKYLFQQLIQMIHSSNKVISIIKFFLVQVKSSCSFGIKIIFLYGGNRLINLFFKHCTTTYDTQGVPQLTVGAAHELETSVLHGHPVLENGEVILKSFSVLVNVAQLIENLENFYNQQNCRVLSEKSCCAYP